MADSENLSLQSAEGWLTLTNPFQSKNLLSSNDFQLDSNFFSNSETETSCNTYSNPREYIYPQSQLNGLDNHDNVDIPGGVRDAWYQIWAIFTHTS